MIPPVRQRPRARLDLLEQFIFLAEQASVELAQSYLAAVDQTCLQLNLHPHIRKLIDFKIGQLTGIRRFPVRGFGSYLIFYLPSDQDGIVIIRVLHRARDLDNIFLEQES